MPTVSVVIPTYNRRDLLPETLESVLKQTYQDFEILVADDGSTDGTDKLFDEGRYGGRVRYIRLPHTGLPASGRNAGIRAASGKYVAFLDSDDLWVPRKLEWQVGALELSPDLCWSYGNAERFSTESAHNAIEVGIWQFREGNVFESLLMGNFIATCTVVVRKDCFDEVGDFDLNPELRSTEDYEMWLRLAARYKLHAVRSTVAHIREYGSRLTSDMTKSFNPELKAYESVQRKVGVDSGLYKKALAALHLRHFRYAVMANSQQASFHLRESWRLNPFRCRTALYKFLYFICRNPSVFAKWIKIEKIIKKLTSFI